MREQLVETAEVVAQPVHGSMGGRPPALKRACPVCDNSSRQRCEFRCATQEFEVLRCRDCGVTFINEVIDDNFGFSEESAVKAEPLQVLKAATDFERMNLKLSEMGFVQSHGRSLLDVGCGIGVFLDHAQKAGWNVVGLELSPAVANYAREENGFNVLNASIESNTNLPSNAFDVITLFGVIEHLAFPNRAIEECVRMLRPGGVLILQTPSEDGIIRRASRVFFQLTAGAVNFYVKELYQTAGGHSVCFNKRSMNILLTRHGLEAFCYDPSTYGFKVLLHRFKGLAPLQRLTRIVGTFALFLLGQMTGLSNHVTVYARKPVAEVYGSREN